MTKTLLYHVTPAFNIASILERGILPQLSPIRPAFSWYVNTAELVWALGHCSVRHNCPVAAIAVAFVIVEWEMLVTTRWPGRFKTTAIFHPDQFVLGREIVAYLSSLAER